MSRSIEELKPALDYLQKKSDQEFERSERHYTVTLVVIGVIALVIFAKLCWWGSIW